MPLIQVFTSAPPPDPASQQALLGQLSKLMAARFGKPERWVMTCLCPGLAMTFAGTPEPAAFVVIKNIGTATPEDTAGISRAVCDRLAAGIGVPADRIYIHFEDAVDYKWGWNGSTFG
jgi:phenylpyruvate tautomerase PptA (4-oxalocrotonate tautomerase family)